MKRSGEPGPSTAPKRPRSDPQTASNAFPPDQKRRATDVCRKGSDGTGWIEGKVYQRGRLSGETWEFMMTAELGSRVQVLLSGSHFGELPIAVGAQVRILTRGLVMEVVEHPQKLLLPKRFAWREQVTLYVYNPKTEEQAFIDTWADTMPITLRQHGGSDANIAETPDVTTKRRTPEPACKAACSVRSPKPITSTTSMQVSPPSGPMVVDEVVRKDVALQLLAESPKEQTKSGDSQSDSQNPQSLPSPPPELIQVSDAGGQPDKGSSGELEDQTCITTNSPAEGCVPAVEDLSLKTMIPCIAVENDARPARPDGRKTDKRSIRKKDKRKLKQLEKAGRLKDDVTTKPPLSHPTTDVVEVEGDEQYWDDDDALPDEIFIDDVIQQAMNVAEKVEHDDALVDRATASTVDPSDGKPDTPLPQPIENDGDQANSVDPIESLKTGCTAGFVSYTPLARVHGVGLLHIMGVAESPGIISQTKMSEFAMRLALYDPTNYGTAGFSVTLFEKTKTSLPKVEAGDVLLLRAIQVDQFNGCCAIAPSFKGWQWAVFHVKSGMLSSAPEDSCALRHFKPEMSELQFSIRLGDWWREISSKTVTFDPTTSRGGRRSREHKVIRDVASEEYFDCTVEVLHGLRNENGVHTVFVTDYTHNAAVSPTQGEWCPPRMAPFVLRIEMWDSSAEVGPKMQPGEYYSIRNMRARISGGGYLEGKMQEGQKITKLDEDQLENQPRLAELLRRKAEWETEMNATGGVHEFPHQLIREAEENHHFKCTVEVVHISPKDDCTFLYITDYTPRNDLVPISVGIAPSTLADHIVRVELRDAQVDIAKNLEAGDFVAIRNLRLRPSGGGTLLAGRLGGDQRLITKLNSKATGNTDLRALLSRKGDWTKAQSKSKREGKQTAARAARQAATEAAGDKTPASGSGATHLLRQGKSKRKRFTTIQDVKASISCPAVYRIRARAVDFCPDDLRECTVLRCTSCDETLPRTRRRCIKCDDAMDDETSVEALFQLWIRVADQDGATLDVSVADERCSVLQGLSPGDIYEDDDAFAMLVARMTPLLGDLLEVSNGEARRRPLAQGRDEGNAPLMELTVGSWLPEGEPDTAEARAYVVLKHAPCEDDEEA
ncbi:hypothetical protein BC628DRAFT_1387561 [Trametes gibbosa]|nr:hypothetical protein BC628DRAFT_1387561 [Trametes gibbosa]